MNMKKGFVICFITAILSLITIITIMIIIANVENWNTTISEILKIITRVSWGCFLISILGIAYFRQKNKAQKINDKIKELEQEIKRLKNK